MAEIYYEDDKRFNELLLRVADCMKEDWRNPEDMRHEVLSILKEEIVYGPHDDAIDEFNDLISQVSYLENENKDLTEENADMIEKLERYSDIAERSQRDKELHEAHTAKEIKIKLRKIDSLLDIVNQQRKILHDLSNRHKNLEGHMAEKAAGVFT